MVKISFRDFLKVELPCPYDNHSITVEYYLCHLVDCKSPKNDDIEIRVKISNIFIDNVIKCFPKEWSPNEILYYFDTYIKRYKK